MKKIFKRISAAVIALAVMLTAVVFDVPEKLIAAAAGETAQAEHTNHKVCVGATCTGCSHEDITDWQPISNEAGLNAMTDGGHYYLTAPVTLTDQVKITGNITFCLNGQKITAAIDNRIFTVESSGSLTLCDCVGSGKLMGGSDATSYYTGNGGGVYVRGTFTMYGGTISGNTADNYGGGVRVNGIFTMYGGTISDQNEAGGGGGVYVSGTFTMNGGTISNNSATGSTASNGGGVYVGPRATFTMNDGTISNNTATGTASDAGGGGVYVNGSGAEFTMCSGTISGNIGKSGGVYAGFGTSFTMIGGTISGNTATTNGGGVYVCGTATLNGKVDITGNKKSDNSANNVDIYSGKILTIGESFSSASKIGVTAAKAPTGCSTGTVAVTGAVSSDISDISGSFTADKEGQAVVYKDNTVQLALPHNYSESWSSDDTNHYHECSVCGDKKDTAAHSGGTATCQTQAACSVCGQTYGDKADHNFSEDWTADDEQHYHACLTEGCTEKNGAASHTFVQKSDGTNHWQECSVCEYKKDIMAHSWSDWKITTSPTITTEGTAERTCQDCSTTETKTLPKVDLSGSGSVPEGWNVEIKQPTMTEAGKIEYKDADDNVLATVEIPALNAASGEGGTSVWTKAEVGEGANQSKNPTPTAGGTFVYTSADYGTVTVNVPALNAKKEDGSPIWTKSTDTAKNEEPSLTKSGSYTYTSDYGEVTVEVPALSDDAWTKTATTKPSISAGGEFTYTSDYGTVTVDVPKLTDTEFWKKKATGNTDPGAETTGSYTYTSDYGEVTVDVPKLSDSVWTKTTTPATEETDGKDVYTSAYGTVEVTIPALGHTHKFAEAWSKDDTYHWHAATCGHTDQVKDKDEHSWNTGEVTTEPTATESGVKTFTCTVCAATKTEDIPALGSDNACGTNATWAYDETTKTLTITGTGDMTDWTAEDPAPWADKAAEIEKVAIGDGITSIGDNAFEDCTALTDVTIPDSVTEIGDNAFAGCTDLETVTFEGGNPPTMGNDVFKDCAVDKIVVPEGAEDTYKAESGFTDLTDKITADNGNNDGNDNACGTNATWAYDETTKTLTITGTGDMTDWTAEDPAPWADKAAEIEKVAIGDGINSIGDNAFEDCTSLTEVTIPDSVTEIGDGAFDGCTSLTDVTIPEGVENIGDNAFAGCTDLEKVTFEGENPPTMGSDVFKDCTVDKIVVPEGSEDAYKGENGFTGLIDKITADTSDNPGSDDGNTDEPENPGDNDDNNNDSGNSSDSGNSGNSGNSSGGESNDSSNSGDTGNSSSDNENTSKDVQLGENVPKTEFATPTEELISAVLDPEEITQIRNSDKVDIVLEIADTVSNEDKQKVESVLEANAELRFAQYMDITLYKVINDIKTQVTTTNKPIRITFEVPADLRKSGRMFEVYRVHNGETALLPDLDNDENTVTIETDRFSTYALVYRDKASASESGNPSTGIAVSLIPLVTAAATLMVAINRKKE